MLRRIFLIVGAAVFAGLVARLGPGRIGSMLLRLGWGFLAIALVYAGHQVVRTAALQRCLPATARCSFGDLLWIRIAGEAVTYLTFAGPFLAEPTKAWLLKRRGLTAEQGFAATLTEYFVYTLLSSAIAIAALVVLLLRFEPSGAVRAGVIAVVAAMSLFLVVAVLAIARRVHLIGAILERLMAIPPIRRRWGLDLARVHRMEDLLLAVLRDSPGRLIGIVAIDLGAQALLVVELYWMMRMLGLVFPPLYAVLIDAAGKFAGAAFFFIPARLGAAEGAFALIFEAVGLPGAAGFTVSFVRRLRSALVAGVGAVALSRLSRDTPAPR